MFPPLELIFLKLQLWGLKRKAAAQKATLAKRQAALGEKRAFKGLRDDRHQLVHGAVEDIGTDDELKFVRHIHGAGPLQLDVQEFPPERFLDITTRMSELSKLVREHHMAMNDALLQYRLDQIKR